jgi:hypothetical protein
MSSLSVFVGDARVLGGSREAVVRHLKERFDRDPGERVFVFEDQTGRAVDFDLRGTLDEVLARVAPEPPRVGPERPKLGIVVREVTLLPRHWEWLDLQPNGSSAAIRRLVEDARRRDPEGDRQRLAIEATSRFMTAMAGDLPGFEEATRALFAKDRARLAALIEGWPKDVRAHVAHLLDHAGTDAARG